MFCAYSKMAPVQKHACKRLSRMPRAPWIGVWFLFPNEDPVASARQFVACAHVSASLCAVDSVFHECAAARASGTAMRLPNTHLYVAYVARLADAPGAVRGLAATLPPNNMVAAWTRNCSTRLRRELDGMAPELEETLSVMVGVFSGRGRRGARSKTE